MKAIKRTIAQNFGGPAHKAVSENQQFSLEQVPSLTGKVAVITGGSEGIGYGCLYTMLKHDIKKIFMLSVSKEVADGARDAVKKEMGAETADKIVWFQCDLSDWRKVKKVADEIAKQTDRIDIMINRKFNFTFRAERQRLMCPYRCCTRSHDLPTHRLQCGSPYGCEPYGSCHPQ